MATTAAGRGSQRMYSDLAEWWPLISAPADYAAEAAAFLAMLPKADAPRTMLELGSGGGNLASHTKAHFEMTLCDLSPEMVAVSRRINPELPHLVGDMRTLRLDRTFDVVLIHDAIMYCTTRADVRAALATAAMHCRAAGCLLIVPDCVRESFEPSTDHGGEDGADGRGVRYLEWTFDPDPTDDTFETVYALVLRSADGRTRVELDRHVEGLFSERDWLAWLTEVSVDARVVVDQWDRHVFVGVKR